MKFSNLREESRLRLYCEYAHLSAISFSISLLLSIHRNGENGYTIDKQAEDVPRLLATVIEKEELKVRPFNEDNCLQKFTSS